MEELRAASIVGGAARHMWLSRNGQRGGLAILGLCALLLGGTGAADASDRSPGRPTSQQQPQRSGEKYTGLAKWFTDAKNTVTSYMDVPTMLDEVYTTPPKPLQVFEYGPSRRTFLLYPERYKYQHVCVISRSGKIAEGTWHTRKAPTNWIRTPPYYMRIVRPTPAGLLHYMMTVGKAKLEKVDITITAEDEETGQTHEVTRKMTVVCRTDKDLPKTHPVKKWLTDHRPGWLPKKPETAGRWGPAIDPDEQEGFEAELKAFLVEAIEAAGREERGEGAEEEGKTQTE